MPETEVDIMESHSEEAIFEQFVLEQAQYASLPQVFLETWRRGIDLAGHAFFGDGTREGTAIATDKWQLCPRMVAIKRSFGVLSSGEKVFLAALVSFYNANQGGTLLRRAGVHGLSDLGGLDLARRKVIAALICSYNGW